MKRLVYFLFLLFMAVTVSAQDHLVRRKPKPTQPTTTKPSTKPAKKPTPNSRQSSRSSGASLCPDGKHPHMIDLGLPSGTKWACCNVGANKPEAYGDYYAWGETKTKSTYDWSTYTHCDGTDKTCHNLGSDIAGTEYDVAHVKWGGSWVMPSKEQRDELVNNCTYTWTTMNGVKGGSFTSKKNGKSIFLPAAGGRLASVLDLAGEGGQYWSSTQIPSYEYRADYLDLYHATVNLYYYIRFRGDGLSVRPVSRN